MSFDLFLSDSNADNRFEAVPIHIDDAELTIFPHLFTTREADDLFNQLIDIIDWQQDKIQMYGKQHDIPRLTAWYGDEGCHYEYSGIHAMANPWINELLSIRKIVDQAAGITFNSVLLNLYRDGADGVAWHSDDEVELGKQPIIASLSLGQVRKFQLKHKFNNIRKNFTLPHGSVLLMGKNIQKYWVHQIPKSRQIMSARINLTFRQIINTN